MHFNWNNVPLSVLSFINSLHTFKVLKLEMAHRPTCNVNIHKVMILAIGEKKEVRSKSKAQVFFSVFGFFYSSNFLDDYSHPGFLHIGFRVSDMIAA